MKNWRRVSVAIICGLGLFSCKKDTAKQVQGNYEGTLILENDTLLNQIV